MWISKKKWEMAEKRIADLELQVQSQQEAIVEHLQTHIDEAERLKEALKETEYNLIKNLTSIQDAMVKQVLQELNC